MLDLLRMRSLRRGAVRMMSRWLLRDGRASHNAPLRQLDFINSSSLCRMGNETEAKSLTGGAQNPECRRHDGIKPGAERSELRDESPTGDSLNLVRGVGAATSF
jgi:hypothetical protein